MRNHTVRRKYEKPAVSTVDARKLLEALGPVQCYGTMPGTPAIRQVRRTGAPHWRQ